MRRLFILIAVCMIGMVNALAGITVVPPQDQENDFYELKLSGTVTPSDWNSLSDYVKNAPSLKIVTADGYLMTTDDIHILMGNSNPSIFANSLQSLDMSDAEMYDYNDLYCMSNATSSKGLHELTSFVFPKETTVIPEGMFIGNSKIQEIIMLESDKTNLSKFKIIGANAFKNCPNLVNVRIPEGVEEIGPSAFGGEKVGFNYTGAGFEAIHLPNTLKKIRNAAFANCRNLKSVTIPYNVDDIESSAFQQNPSMTDVYVIGNNVKIKNGAFNENETYNFKYQEDGSVDFSDWHSDVTDGTNTPHPLRLHIPNDDVAKNNYINPYLRALNDPRMTDEMLNNFNTYQNDIITILNDYEGIDPSNGIWAFQDVPYVVMDGYRYFKNGDGIFNAIQNGLYGACGEYAGWRNFMLIADDLEKKIWHDGRLIESRWYSAVFPFNMSYNQLMTAYGAKTDVREFTGVISETDGGKTKLTITFNQRANVPMDHDANSDGNTYIAKGHPYMIHPGTRVEIIEVKEGEEVKETYGRTIAGVSVTEANDEIENGTLLPVSGDLKKKNDDGTFTVEQSGVYTFVGTYEEEGDYLPAHCYYLGMYEGKPETLKFYYTKTAGTTAKNWTQFTSIVMTSLGANGAKSMDMDFSIFNQNVFNDNYGIATSIEKAQTERELFDRIHNLNGQVVGKGSLQSIPKGIYVVNGKKIVVR